MIPLGPLAGRLRAEAGPKRQERDGTLDEWGSGKGCCISPPGSNQSNGLLKTSVLNFKNTTL